MQTDLAGNNPAPGEAAPGVASDTIQGENRAADTINGVPLSATDEATDTILYQHSSNAVEVTKSPTGAQPPGEDIPYVLTFRNTGATPITNPVITDTFPSDADGPMLVYDPDRDGPGTGYTFALTGDPAPTPPNGPAMPTDTTEVTITEAPDGITFTFPAGTVLEVGQTYTITVPLQFRTGLAGNTPVTNTTGIIGDRPWDTCADTVDPSTGACEAETTVYPTRAGALRGVKSVKAVDDELGVLNTRDNPAGCIPDDDGFYVGGCVPVTKPGGDEIWRMTFTNTGNLPQDKVYAIDRLPTPGDTGAITSLGRGSQWTPVPKRITYAGVTGGTVSAVRLFYDTDDDLCTDDLDLDGSCPFVDEGDANPDGDWVLFGEIDDPAVGGSIDVPANATAIKIETDFFDEMFQPTGQLKIDVTTTTPAQSPTAGADTVAWNTVAVAARTDDDGTKGLSPRSEGNKVGVALATGPLDIEKEVTGAGAAFAPDSFQLTVECVSQGEPVDLGDAASVTVTPPDPVRVDDIPWGSACTVSEDADAAGNPSFSATTVTIVSADQTVPVVIATNTYELASLQLGKDISDSAVDENGDPLTYGPFTFAVTCTFPASTPVYATGYDADNPMTVTIASDADEPAPFTGLPAGSDCTATETDDGGADPPPPPAPPAVARSPATPRSIWSSPPTAPSRVTNTVTFTNVFATGSVTIAKAFDGAGADQYGTGPFTANLRCVDSAATDRVIYDGDQELNDGNDYSVTVTDLYVDSTCTVTETDDGGATSSSVSPEGPFQVTAASAETPVAVTNTFDLGSIRLIKQLEGGGADDVAGGTAFTLQLECQVLVNDEIQPVELREDDGVITLTTPDDLEATYTGLPTGARCTVTETDSGGADDVSDVGPGRNHRR